ncbi:MAG: folate-binding protein YgfZ [Rhizobiales bacterium]|nr:folate-binding protein YgfZ [Hyphomicrobiales bacterium]
MALIHTTLLDDRAVLAIAGNDAETLLQGLVTVDLGRLTAAQSAPSGNVFGALLQPQGKIMFDFFIHAAENGYLVDIDKTRAADFLKRLTLYRLRSKVTFSDLSESHAVVVSFGDADAADGPGPKDARFDAMGNRAVVAKAQAHALANATVSAYHAHRIRLGVPEAGKDFAYDDIFPHDAMMDALHGVDFSKGCYVGQEVVSRVQHRGTARKRFYIVEGRAPLGALGDAVMMDDKTVGNLGSCDGGIGLALLRVDKVAEGGALHLAGAPLSARLPAYFRLSSKDA